MTSGRELNDKRITKMFIYLFFVDYFSVGKSAVPINDALKVQEKIVVKTS